MLNLAEAVAQPWKNGGGLTRELLAWPSAADWQVRLSVADIAADGPFSVFQDVLRWFAVLEGDGVRLTVDSTRTALNTGSEPFCFAGTSPTYCELLGGATRDFNLMLRGAAGHMQRVRGTRNGYLTSDPNRFAITLIAIYAINNSAFVQLDDDSCRLGPATLAWQIIPVNSKPRPYSVQSDNALWMEITV